MEEHLKADWDHKKTSHILWSTVKALNPKKPTTNQHNPQPQQQNTPSTPLRE